MYLCLDPKSHFRVDKVAGDRMEFPLPDYRILFLRGGRLIQAQSLAAESDLLAIEQVGGMKSSADVEIWRDDRRLARFRRGPNEVVEEGLQLVNRPVF